MSEPDARRPHETHILIVRHPETEANVNGRYVGRGNSPFTEEGRKQLRRLPRRIGEFAPEHIWTSPLERAVVLAQAAGRSVGVPSAVDERLIELDFGIAEGLTYEEIVERGITFNYKNLDEPVAPQGESRNDIESRSAAFCEHLVAMGGRHAVVTHGGVFRAALVHLLGLETNDIWAFHIHNAQMAYVRVVEDHGMLEEYKRG